MKRTICSCLVEGETCAACGTPVRWFTIGEERYRFHLHEHTTYPSGMRKAVFHPHLPESCRAARVAAMLDLQGRGELREDLSR